MRLLRFRILLVCALGAAAACRGEESLNPEGAPESPPRAGASPAGGEPADAWRAAEAWRAAPGGPTLADFVQARARATASRAWRPPASAATEAVRALDYVAYRGIEYRREEAVWRGEAPFELQLFHPGGGFEVPVRIHLVEEGRARLLPFQPERFNYRNEVAGRDLSLPPEAGYAGLRVLHPLNDPGRMDEVVSFLGASYFRLLGPGHVYGLSTRGVAVNTADPGGEEFPAFTDFWVEKPAPGADRLVLHALLDGPSLTGAYRFELVPGVPAGAPAPSGAAVPSANRERPEPTAARPTVLLVDATLFARRDIALLGVAPLTSMYLHGTFDPGGDDDVRPRVHDSEGLLVHTGRGEWIWRPLTNRPGVSVTSLLDVDPAGYGLVQRDRDFASYLDLEASYHRRPSEWVAPEGAWGGGSVRLVELPTDSEFNDNIVAFWAPDGGMRAGTERRWRYRLVTFDDRLEGGTLPGGALAGESRARVVRTRIGWDALPGQADAPPRSRRRIVVDFEGGPLDTLSADAALDMAHTVSSGVVEDLRLQRLPSGGRRVTFALTPEGDRPADIRVFLRSDSATVSETWSYLLEWNDDR